MTIHSCNLQDLDKLGITLINRHPIMESEHFLELPRELNDISNVFGNMGIVPYEDGYLCSCRNFYYDLPHNYPSKKKRGVTPTHIFFKIDSKFNFNYSFKDITQYDGKTRCEDGRLFSYFVVLHFKL